MLLYLNIKLVRGRGSRGRVALGGCPPRAPTDPDMHTLEHPAPQAMASLRDGDVTYPEMEKLDRLANSAIRCCFVDTLIEFPSIRRSSQQRFHVP